MKQNSQDLSQQSKEPIHPLEAMALRLEEKLRASGLTVEVMEPSDSDEYTVTFPPNRQQKAKPKKVNSSKAKHTICIDYGYDSHSIVVSQQQMDAVNFGEEISIKGQGFWIEGKKTQDVWNFNCTDTGSLEVDGEDGHQIYIGNLRCATIFETKQ